MDPEERGMNGLRGGGLVRFEDRYIGIRGGCKGGVAIPLTLCSPQQSTEILFLFPSCQ